MGVDQRNQQFTPVLFSGWRWADVEQIWHIYDSHGQIMALAFRPKKLESDIFPLIWSKVVSGQCVRRRPDVTSAGLSVCARVASHPFPPTLPVQSRATMYFCLDKIRLVI